MLPVEYVFNFTASRIYFSCNYLMLPANSKPKKIIVIRRKTERVMKLLFHLNTNFFHSIPNACSRISEYFLNSGPLCCR